MSGSLPRLCMFLTSRYSGQPTIEPSAASASMSLMTSSLYGRRNVAMNHRMPNVTTQR